MPESRKELARAYSSQGLVHAAYGRFAEAEEAHRQALALRESLVRDFPAVAEYRQDVARSLVNLATVLLTDRPVRGRPTRRRLVPWGSPRRS